MLLKAWSRLTHLFSPKSPTLGPAQALGGHETVAALKRVEDQVLMAAQNVALLGVSNPNQTIELKTMR